MLIGRDRRVARLTGGDRLAPVPQLVSGAAALAALQSAGLASVLLRGSGGAALQALVAAGVSAVALQAAAAAPVQLQALLASGRSPVALLGGGDASFAELLADGSSTVTRFSPSQIAAVAAGYYWDPAQAVNSGLATFSLPEAQGKTTYNQITPSLAAAPTIGTINGRAVIQHTNLTSPSIDSVTRNSAQLARGWTGAMMVAGWFQMPGAGAGAIFAHWRSNQNFLLATGTTRVDISAHDGTANREQQHPVASGWALTPVYLEALFDPSQGATNRLQFWINRVQVTPSVTATMGATMRDTASFLSFSGTVSDGSGFNLSGSYNHGVFYLCNGIPSAVERDQLFNHRRLAA